jgi:hypothetical protein
MTQAADLLVHGHGSIYLLRATSRRGQRWIDERISDDRQEWAGAVVCAVIALTPRSHAALARVSPLPDRVHPAARRPPSARPALPPTVPPSSRVVPTIESPYTIGAGGLVQLVLSAMRAARWIKA